MLLFLLHPSWPVRTLSFSYDSQIIATASEDLYIDLVGSITHVYILTLLRASMDEVKVKMWSGIEINLVHKNGLRTSVV